MLLLRGESVLMRAWALLVGLVVLGGAAAHAAPVLVDTVLAQVGSAPVMLSDVALARALGVLGLAPAPGPITEAELSSYLDTQLAVREANQIGIEVSAADVDRAWESAGGAVLATRLEAAGIDPAWARRLIASDLQVKRFMDLRFRAFAFVTEFDVDEALGPGSHDEAARERARDRLRAEMVAKAFAAWIEDARRRVEVRRVSGVTAPWLAPFTIGPPVGK